MKPADDNFAVFCHFRKVLVLQRESVSRPWLVLLVLEYFHQCKLIFRFQLFENEYQNEPYTVQDVVIKRTREGETYIE